MVCTASKVVGGNGEHVDHTKSLMPLAKFLSGSQFIQGLTCSQQPRSNDDIDVSAAHCLRLSDTLPITDVYTLFRLP